MKIEMPADKKKEIEECVAKVSELLRTAKTLDEAVIPDSVKSMSVFELEVTPVRVKNMLGNIGVCTLWELVHFDLAKCRRYRGGFNASKIRMIELGYAIKEATDLLLAAQNGSKAKKAMLSVVRMSGEVTMSDKPGEEGGVKER